MEEYSLEIRDVRDKENRTELRKKVKLNAVNPKVMWVEKANLAKKIC